MSGCRKQLVQIVNWCDSPVNTRLCEYYLSWIQWCRWGLSVTRYPYVKDWVIDTLLDIYSDWWDATGWIEWDCEKTSKDPEIVCMTNDNSETIIKWVVIFSYDWTTWTSTLNNLDGTLATWYTVIPCATNQWVIKWEIRCDNGTNIIPFYDTETDWTASATIAFWFNPLTNSVIIPSGTQTPWQCIILKLIDIPNCDWTTTQVEVDNISVTYLLNQKNKHTERLYDNITATLTGTIWLIITWTNVELDSTGIVATNRVGANYILEVGTWFSDVGSLPSRDFANEPDWNYEIKIYRTFIFPEGRWDYLISTIEIDKTGSTITVIWANPIAVNRSITYTSKEVLQDYCDNIPVWVPYLADWSNAIINWTLSLTYREEKTERLGISDANNNEITEVVIPFQPACITTPPLDISWYPSQKSQVVTDAWLVAWTSGRKAIRITSAEATIINWATLPNTYTVVINTFGSLMPQPATPITVVVNLTSWNFATTIVWSANYLTFSPASLVSWHIAFDKSSFGSAVELARSAWITFVWLWVSLETTYKKVQAIKVKLVDWTITDRFYTVWPNPVEIIPTANDIITLWACPIQAVPVCESQFYLRCDDVNGDWSLIVEFIREVIRCFVDWVEVSRTTTDYESDAITPYTPINEIDCPPSGTINTNLLFDNNCTPFYRQTNTTALWTFIIGDFEDITATIPFNPVLPLRTDCPVPEIREVEVCATIDWNPQKYELIRVYTRDLQTGVITILHYEDTFWNIITGNVVETCCDCSAICYGSVVVPLANRRSDSYGALMAQQKTRLDDWQYDATYAWRWPVWAPRNHYYRVKIYDASNTLLSTNILWPYAVDPTNATYLQFLSDVSSLTSSLWVALVWPTPALTRWGYQVEYNDATGFSIILEHWIDNHAGGIIRNPDIKQAIRYETSRWVVKDSVINSWDINNPALDAGWREWTAWFGVVDNINITII